MSSASEVQGQPARLPSNLAFIIAMGVLAISSSSIFIRYAQSEGIPSLLIGAGRLVIAALLLTPFVLSRYQNVLKSLKPQDWGLALLSGLFLALHFATWVSSLEFTSVLLSTVLVTTSPIWVALLEFFFLRFMPTRWVIVGLMIAIAGGLVIAAGSSGTVAEDTTRTYDHLRGGALAIVGSISVAVYLVVGRKLRAKMPVIPYIWLVYGCSGIIMSAVVLLAGIPITGYSSEGYLWLLACAIFPQLIGHSTLNYAIGYISATLVGMVTQLEPIGSAFLAFILFSETPTFVQILGSAIILGGVMLASQGQAQSKKGEEKRGNA